MQPQDLNANTQPFAPMRVFARWDVIPNAWYAVLPSASLGRGKAQSVTVCQQRLALFRGQDGVVRALDAFCPHMGTDLGIGRVVDNTLRCFFHQWRFDGTGRCVEIPVQTHIPPQACVRAYATQEAYGYIWVYPDAVAPYPVAEFEGLEGQPLLWSHDVPHEGACHHHVSMINGIDAQHLRTVHGISMAADVDVTERNGNIVDYVVTGAVEATSLTQRLVQALIGKQYSYAMRYQDAALGLLTTVRDSRLFGTGPRLPRLHMAFAYTPLAPGRVRTHTIFVARKPKGLLALLWTHLVLWATRQGYYFLRGADAVVYDNIRFQPKTLLPMDAPVSRYLAYVNRLTPSDWSQPDAREPQRAVALKVVDDGGP